MSTSIADRGWTVAASVGAGVAAWLAWRWSPMLVAGTPLAELAMVVQLAAVVLALSVIDPIAARAFRRRDVTVPEPEPEPEDG